MQRVLRDAVDAVDGDAPGQVRRRPVQLLVEEVAPAADRLHHEDAGGDDVAQLQNGWCQSRRITAARDDPGEDASVHTEARVWRHHDREQVVLVPLPLVDDVVQPAADQGGDRHDDDPVVHQPGIGARRRASRVMTTYVAARPTA